jgi:RND family efflux transporter MFP subunit
MGLLNKGSTEKMRTSLRIRHLLLFVAAALLFFIGRWWFGFSTKNGSPLPPPAVSVMTITHEPITYTEELPGRTLAYRSSEVRPQVGGIIIERFFEEGDFVKEGTALYRINPAPFEATLASAKATLASEKAKLARYEILRKSDAVSQQELDDQRALVTRNESSVTQAKINIDYTYVRAPISGWIGLSMATQGALVSASQPDPLTTISQLDPIYVDIPQPSASAVRLKRIFKDKERDAKNHLKIELFVGEDKTPYEFLGTLTASDIAVNTSTDSVLLRLLFPNPHKILLPGLFVRARFSQIIEQDGIFIPQQALTRAPDGQGIVFVVDEKDMVDQRFVRTSQAIGNKWRIDSGLNIGDRIIVEGIIKLRQAGFRPGNSIKVSPSPYSPTESKSPRNNTEPKV